MPYHNRRWDGDHQYAKSLIDLGIARFPLRLTLRFQRIRPVRSTWHDRVGRGGGTAWGLGAHLLDQAIDLLGPAQLVSFETAQRRVDSLGADEFEIVLRHDSGASTTALLSDAGPMTGPRLELEWDGGLLRCWGTDSQEKRLRSGISPSDPRWSLLDEPQHATLRSGSVTSDKTITSGDAGRFWAKLASSIDRDGPPPVPLNDVRRSVGILEQMHNLMGT